MYLFLFIYKSVKTKRCIFCAKILFNPMFGLDLIWDIFVTYLGASLLLVWYWEGGIIFQMKYKKGTCYYRIEKMSSFKAKIMRNLSKNSKIDGIRQLNMLSQWCSNNNVKMKWNLKRSERSLNLSFTQMCIVT